MAEEKTCNPALEVLVRQVKESADDACRKVDDLSFKLNRHLDECDRSSSAIRELSQTVGELTASMSISDGRVNRIVGEVAKLVASQLEPVIARQDGISKIAGKARSIGAILAIVLASAAAAYSEFKSTDSAPVAGKVEQAK